MTTRGGGAVGADGPAAQAVGTGLGAAGGAAHATGAAGGAAHATGAAGGAAHATGAAGGAAQAAGGRRAFSVAVFARHEGADGVRRVLLIRHRRLGVWLPVGGEIEAGETPLEAARRELREETGLEGRFEEALGVDGTPRGLLGYEEHPAGSKGLHLNFAFVADVETDRVVPNDEVVEHRWVTDAADLDAPLNVRELARMALFPGASPLEAVARAWLDAFNGRDLERLLALYADDAVHTSPKLRDRHPETAGEIRGKGALRTWWRGAMDRLPTLRYEVRHLVASGGRVFMEYDRVVDGEPTMPIAEVLVVERGIIVRSHVFHG